jgi:uncharacterized membrane protein
LDVVGVHIPLLREMLMLIYLLFTPGIILLRILRFHHLNVIEGVLYTVGLSVVTVMVVGLFTNTVYVHGITPTPLTLVPFMATMTVLVAALCVLCYWRDRDYSGSTAIDVRMPVSPVALGLLLLPFLSVFGAYLFNTRGTAAGSVILLLSVASLIFVCGFTGYVQSATIRWQF